MFKNQLEFEKYLLNPNYGEIIAMCKLRCANIKLLVYNRICMFGAFNKLSIIYFRDLQLPCHEVNHYTYFVFEMSLIITCYTAYSYIRLIYLIKRRYK